MKNVRTVASLAGVLALSVTPAFASQGSNGQGATHRATPGPKASPSAKAKAYGKLCQKESKKHVAGMKGTPFSQCVTAMAKVAGASSSTSPSSTPKVNPTTACKTESKKHVAGMKGTPFSQCVSAAAKLQRQERQQSGSSQG